MTVPKGISGWSATASWLASTSAGAHTCTGGTAARISTYLVTATLGKFDGRTGRTTRRLPVYLAVDPTAGRGRHRAAAAADMVDLLDDAVRALPLSASRGDRRQRALVGYALETATKPVFDRAPTS